MKKILLSSAVVLILCSAGESQNINKAEQIIDSILSGEPVSDPEPSSVRKPEKNAEKRTEQAKPAAGFQRIAEERMLLKDATGFYNDGMLEEALIKVNRIIDEHAQGGVADPARVLAGKIYIKQMRYDEAIEELNRVPERSGEYPAALFYLAGAAELKGDKGGALSLYRKAGSINPGGDIAPAAFLQAARLQKKMGQGEAAVETVVHLIENYPDRDTIDDAYFLLARIYETDHRIRDLETARSLYSLFLKKAAAGEPRFKDSPLLKQAENDLEKIETRYFRMD